AQGERRVARGGAPSARAANLAPRRSFPFRSLGQEIRTLDHSKPRLALLDTPLRKRHHSIPQDRVRWIRSYVVKGPDGRFGSVCIYEACDPESFRAHARLASWSRVCG